MMTIVVNAEEKFGVTHPRRRGQEPQDRRRRRHLHHVEPGVTASAPRPRAGGSGSRRTHPARPPTRSFRHMSQRTHRRHRHRRHHAHRRDRRPRRWDALLAGTSGARTLDARLGRAVRPAGDLRGRQRSSARGGAGAGPRPSASTPRRSSPSMAAREAWADAGTPEVEPERLGVDYRAPASAASGPCWTRGTPSARRARGASCP